MKRVLLALCLVLAACSRPVVTARRTIVEPPSERELEAERAVRGASCSPSWSYLFPGLGQLCLGQTGKGLGLLGAGVAELSTTIVAAASTEGGLEHPAAGLPAVALQDLWLYGIADVVITEQLARRTPYAPQDSLEDLLAAPFNAEVMKRPEVWAGLLGVLAVGVGASLVIDDVDTSEAGSDPNILGKEFDPAVGYPLGFGIGAGLFTHVGIAEEAAFRGLLQSGLTRATGENTGFVLGSLIFGLAHASNALLLDDPGDRRRYLVYGVPVITVIGSYLGWVYKESGYALAPSTAIHFWYDLLLTSTFFVLDPKGSPLSAGVSFDF